MINQTPTTPNARLDTLNLNGKQMTIISKYYVGYESRNQSNYQTCESFADAQSYLDGLERSWIRNGGAVIDRDANTLTVEEGNGEVRIIFKINEAI